MLNVGDVVSLSPLERNLLPCKSTDNGSNGFDVQDQLQEHRVCSGDGNLSTLQVKGAEKELLKRNKRISEKNSLKENGCFYYTFAGNTI